MQRNRSSADTDHLSGCRGNDSASSHGNRASAVLGARNIFESTQPTPYFVMPKRNDKVTVAKHQRAPLLTSGCNAGAYSPTGRRQGPSARALFTTGHWCRPERQIDVHTLIVEDTPDTVWGIGAIRCAVFTREVTA
jgi:hypothetical protein